MRCNSWTIVLVSCLRLSALAQDVPTPKSSPPAKPRQINRPKLVNAPETTFVDGPLDGDGRVDYVAALNEQIRRGITPDNNAAVDVLDIMGPANIALSIRPEFYSALGKVAPPEAGDYFVTSAKMAQLTDGGKAGKNFLESLDKCSKPWATNQFPEVAQWLNNNEKFLDRLVVASKKTRWYAPLIAPPPPPDTPTVMMVSVLLPLVQDVRDHARALNARAMARVHQGNLAAAHEDLLTVFRLGRLLAQGPTLIELLVGFALQGIACEGELQLIEHEKADAALLRKILADLRQLPVFSVAADKVDRGERMMMLDAVVTMAFHGLTTIDTVQGGIADKSMMNNITNWMGKATIDWNEALRASNLWYDRVVAAMRLPSYVGRQKAMTTILEEMKTAMKQRENWMSTVQRDYLVTKSFSKTMARQVVQMLQSLLAPALDRVLMAEIRNQQRMDITKVAVALALYRAEQGEYPDKLEALAPKYLAPIPTDYFVEKPLRYQALQRGYVVYSVGANQKDDNGSGEHPKDDVSARIGKRE